WAPSSRHLPCFFLKPVREGRTAGQEWAPPARPRSTTCCCLLSSRLLFSFLPLFLMERRREFFWRPRTDLPFAAAPPSLSFLRRSLLGCTTFSLPPNPCLGSAPRSPPSLLRLCCPLVPLALSIRQT
ncbi:unnamed protein product, partial [Phaeothamnion confervicola]